MVSTHEVLPRHVYPRTTTRHTSTDHSIDTAAIRRTGPSRPRSKRPTRRPPSPRRSRRSPKPRCRHRHRVPRHPAKSHRQLATRPSIQPLGSRRPARRLQNGSSVGRGNHPRSPFTFGGRWGRGYDARCHDGLSQMVFRGGSEGGCAGEEEDEV